MEHWSTQGLRYLKGVGPKVAEKLHKLGLNNQRDLLFHLPLRYEDRTFVSPLGSLQPGQRSQIEAEVLQAGVQFRRMGRSRRVLVAKLADNTGVITARFFFFNARQQQLFEKGNWLRCYGEVRSALGELEMIHPEVERIDVDDPAPLSATLTPIYPTTEGLHQLTLKRILAQVIDQLQADGVAETLPEDWLEQNNFPGFTSAMIDLHRPESRSDSDLITHNRHPAQHRFVVEELAAHRLALLERRRQLRARKTPRIVSDAGLQQQFLQNLPFELTAAQQRVLAEILQDLSAGKPMIRLVQGDVGSGKTVVAALACLPAVGSGYQVAMMAPTEILAEQHFQNLCLWLAAAGYHGADPGGRRQGQETRKQTGLDRLR